MTRRLRAADQVSRARVGDGPREAVTVQQLKDRIMTQCENEFEQRWGERWLAPGGSGVGRLLREYWIADCSNKADEDAARALYEKLRKRMVTAAAEAEAFRKERDLPDGGGGFAAYALRVLEEAAAQFRPISEMETVAGYSRQDGRAALVARTLSIASRLKLGLSNRDIAVVSLLCEAGPSSWEPYEGWGTMAKVIEDEETRVRGIRNALAIEPSPSGSTTP